MLDTPIPIDPPISNPQPNLVYNNMTVRVMNVVLGTSASFLVFLFNDTNLVSTKNYTMEGADYAQWGSDDQYIYDWILTQLMSGRVD